MTEHPQQSTSGASLLAGMVVGMLLGAAAAVLYAPKPGKETREELLERLDVLKERVDETSKQVTEMVKARLDETRADLEQALDAARTAAQERTSQLRREQGME